MEETEHEPDSVLFIRGISPRLKRLFKAWCAKHGVTMQETILKLIEEKVNEPNGGTRP